MRNQSGRDFAFESLLTACALPDAPMSVIATIRSDYYGMCAQHARFAEALSSSQILLTPMTEEEMLEAITRPAETLGIHIDSGLPELIVSELGHDSTNLALM